jgi:TIR domain
MSNFLSRYWYITKYSDNNSGLLRDIQSCVPKFCNYYPRHQDWIERSIKLLSTGNRDAFVVFVAATAENEFKPQYAGSVILKRAFSGNVEVKNLIIDQRLFKNDDIEIVKDELLNRVYEYCQRRGVHRIFTELPVGIEEQNLISYFPKKGFRIASLVKAPYGPNNDFYLLEKEIKPSYHGDPFDFVEMVKWIHRYKFSQFELVDSDTQQINSGSETDIESVNCFIYNYKLKVIDDKLSAHLKDLLSIKIKCLILPDGETVAVPNELFSTPQGTSFVFINDKNKHLPSYKVDSSNSVAFSSESVHELIAGEEGGSLIYFDKSEIGGLVISISPDHFSNLINIASNQKKLAYFLWWGGFGRYAKLDEENESKKIVIFHFPITPKDQGVEAQGGYFIAEIEKCRKEKNEDIWDLPEYKELPKFQDNKEDLRFAQNVDNHSETKVVGLICEKLTYIDGVPNFLDIVEDSDGLDAKNYFKEKENFSGIMTSYITKRIASKLNHLLETRQPTGNKKILSGRADVFISYAREDEKIVARLIEELCNNEITYWIDKNEINWGSNIVEKITNGLRKSKYVLAVISQNYLIKPWAKAELDTVTNVELQEDRDILLPLLVGSESEVIEITANIPIHSRKRYLTWDNNPKNIVDELKIILGKGDKE